MLDDLRRETETLALEAHSTADAFGQTAARFWKTREIHRQELLRVAFESDLLVACQALGLDCTESSRSQFGALSRALEAGIDIARSRDRLAHLDERLALALERQTEVRQRIAELEAAP